MGTHGSGRAGAGATIIIEGTTRVLPSRPAARNQEHDVKADGWSPVERMKSKAVAPRHVDRVSATRDEGGKAEKIGATLRARPGLTFP